MNQGDDGWPDRRGAKRAPVDLRVTLELLEPYEGYVGHLRDVSESGVFVGTPEALEVSDRINITIAVGDETVCLLGEVVRVVRPIGVALRFVDPDPAVLRRLNDHLRGLGKGTPDLIPIEP